MGGFRLLGGARLLWKCIVGQGLRGEHFKLFREQATSLSRSVDGTKIIDRNSAVRVCNLKSRYETGIAFEITVGIFPYITVEHRHVSLPHAQQAKREIWTIRVVRS